MKRYLKVSADICEHPAFRKISKNATSKYEDVGVFIDMLQSANFKNGLFEFYGKTYVIKRGELPASFRYLSQKYNYSMMQIRGFIKRLETHKVIKRRIDKSNNFQIITFLNYDEWQGRVKPKEKDPPPVSKNKPPANPNEITNEKNENKNEKLKSNHTNNSTTLEAWCEGCTTTDDFIERIGNYHPEWTTSAANRSWTPEQTGYELKRFWNYYTQEQPSTKANWFNAWTRWKPDNTQSSKNSHGSGHTKFNTFSNAMRDALHEH